MFFLKRKIKKQFPHIRLSIYRYYYMAFRLTKRLCSLFGMETFSREKQLDPELQSGELDQEWEYFIHGGQCRFTNHKTGMKVEAELMDPEKKLPDPWFFMVFVESSSRDSLTARIIGGQYGKAFSLMEILEKDYAPLLKPPEALYGLTFEKLTLEWIHHQRP